MLVDAVDTAVPGTVTADPQLLYAYRVGDGEWSDFGAPRVVDLAAIEGQGGLTVHVRDESGLITAETRVFLRDAYDHAVQALELVESLRETATSVMEIYLSAQNQRLNEVMKVLTVISTLFIPLTFIASIYGMNFQFMPELHWRYGYLWALGLMVATAAGLVMFFKRRGWW